MTADAAAATGTAITPRARKFRQAAFVYLHVALLYQFAVYAIWKKGLMPAMPGHEHFWLVSLAAVAVVAFIFWGLWSWQNVWVARVVWLIHGLRIPVLIDQAFLSDPTREIAILPPSLYMAALLGIIINLWMLARAGWDL